ncbi:hypothetical protein [Kaistia terrae]|uniref:Uncharacterized protein n=1 Tax=Kaistia terrae TaxID=537017 RepID=A0ABW0Q0B8_9HYPH|nr:hypothetical protein [Kaistia terrae]MCX5578764.1 hypothetical protein [Kaistia terrae]
MAAIHPFRVFPGRRAVRMLAPNPILAAGREVAISANLLVFQFIASPGASDARDDFILLAALCFEFQNTFIRPPTYPDGRLTPQNQTNMFGVATNKKNGSHRAPINREKRRSGRACLPW